MNQFCNTHLYAYTPVCSSSDGEEGEGEEVEEVPGSGVPLATLLPNFTIIPDANAVLSANAARLCTGVIQVLGLL